MIRTIIVDDEPLAVEVLTTHCNHIDDVKIVSPFNNAIDANAYLAQHEVDLMFLDIQMPALNGIDFLKSLSHPPSVIFTTAFPEYAVEGFNLDVVDYLLKPISFERFFKAINKVRETMLPHSSESASEDNHFFVKADKKLIKINYDDVLYIEGLKDYVIIRTQTGRVITLQTMKSLTSKLPSQHFMRIHRSFIISLDKIEAIVGNMVEITERGEKKHISVGKNYREQLLQIVNERKL